MKAKVTDERSFVYLRCAAHRGMLYHKEPFHVSPYPVDTGHDWRFKIVGRYSHKEPHMRYLFSLLIITIGIASCKKSSSEKQVSPLPAMQYTDLQNQTVGIGQGKLLDLDGDGHRDLGFSTLLVGDPLLPGEKNQFYATGSFNTFFPINSAEEVPRIGTGTFIQATAFPGYEWFNAPSILLAQRIELTSGLVYWEGTWKTTAHRFLPFYILREDNRYFGWIELSFDTASQKATLHRAAVSTEADKGVKAGVK